MTRRKSEIVRLTNERDFLHLVELALVTYRATSLFRRHERPKDFGKFTLANLPTDNALQLRP
jgi:hypothetical protein